MPLLRSFRRTIMNSVKAEFTYRTGYLRRNTPSNKTRSQPQSRSMEQLLHAKIVSGSSMTAGNYSSPKSFASIATRALFNSTCMWKNIRAESQTLEQHLWFVFHFTTALWYETLRWSVTGPSYSAKHTHEAPAEVKDNWHSRAGTEQSMLHAN